MKSDSTVVNGSTFIVTNQDGTPTRDHDGFYHEDTQHLDRYEIETKRNLEPLENAAPRPGERVLHEGTPLVDGSRTVHVTRRQVVDDALAERVTVTNLSDDSRTIELTITAGTRFDDLFEVRGHEDGRTRELSVESVNDASDVETVAGDSGALFTYDPSDIDPAWATTLVTDVGSRADDVSLSLDDSDERVDTTLRVEIDLDPDEETVFHMTIHPKRAAPSAAETFETLRDTVRERETKWVNRTTTPNRSGWDDVLAEAERNLLELTLDTEYGPVLAAGVPWFATAFGRDSLIAAYQAIEVRPDIAQATCRYLAANQATETDEFRAAAPGKILHEVRFGETTIREETPHSPYYGTIDATPLFVVLVHEVWDRTGDDAFVRDMWPHVNAALQWLREHGDSDGDGFVEYPADHNGHGLTHQAWKDSGDGIVHPDGSHPDGPLAVAEVQGYAFDARRRAADLAESVMAENAVAEQLRDEASNLQKRFDEAFWLPGEKFYAIALDGANDPVPAVGSNPGHCLWSGIVPENKRGAVVDRLMSDDMFSGWGIRTLSSTHDAYNPQSYHRGSVWPHDNSLCVLGIAAAGHPDEAERVAERLVDAAQARGNDRLPELFGGFDREKTTVPVEYGEACEPQAWAAATPFALHRAVTHEKPEAPEQIR